MTRRQPQDERDAALVRRALSLAVLRPGGGPEPARRRGRAGPRRSGGRRGVPPRRREPARRGRGAGPGGRARPRRHGLRHARTLQPHRPHRTVRAGAGRCRVCAASCTPRPTRARASGGGADTLRAAGVEVVGGVLAEEALALNEAWTFAVVHGRPRVTWKFAATLDGRSAAADGSSAWITGPLRPRRRPRPARRLRRRAGRHRHGAGRRPAPDRPPARRLAPAPAAAARGHGACGRCPPQARVLDDAAPTVLLPTRDPAEALRWLASPRGPHGLARGRPHRSRRPSCAPASSTRS